MSDALFITVTPSGPLDSLGDLARLIDRASPAVRARFLGLVEGSRALVDLEALAVAIETGQVEAAIGIADQIGPGLSNSLEAAYAAAGVDLAAILSDRTDQIINFNSLSDRAITHNQLTRARLVREITADTQLMLTDALTDGLARGLRGDVIARELRDSIGLTAHQRRIVANYREALRSGSSNALGRVLRDKRFDPTVRRGLLSAGADRVPLTNTQIDRMVQRYEERFIAHRADTIAFTETQRAANAADEELFRQAIEDGVIESDNLSNRWQTAQDEKVRSSHRAMNGQSQPLGTPFRSGDGNSLRFPGDPNAPASDTVRCRCVIVRKLAKAVPR